MIEYGKNVMQDVVFRLARGSYQEGLLGGRASWAGSDLRGRGREYAGRYTKSRHSLARRLEHAGYDLQWERRKHNRLVLVVEIAHLDWTEQMRAAHAIKLLT